MPFTKAEVLNELKALLRMTLRACDTHMWPYSAYLRWKVKVGYRERVKEIEEIADKRGWN